jgi:hypothetical protein
LTSPEDAVAECDYLAVIEACGPTALKRYQARARIYDEDDHENFLGAIQADGTIAQTYAPPTKEDVREALKIVYAEHDYIGVLKTLNKVDEVKFSANILNGKVPPKYFKPLINAAYGRKPKKKAKPRVRGKPFRYAS